MHICRCPDLSFADMAEVFQPQQPFMAISMDHTSIRPDSDAFMPQSSTVMPPEPNPPFVFPMQPEKKDMPSPHTRAASTMDLPASRRSVNRARPQRLSLDQNPASALPVFEFNPSASSDSETTPQSPTHSPSRNRPHYTHAVGHRRNGSGFIGGDSKTSGLGLMSTSPTKGEGSLPTPQSSRAGPPNSRRGHAHRRSGAVSSHDLSMILKPSGDRRGSCSAPTTPSDLVTQRGFLNSSDRSISQPSLESHGPETPIQEQNNATVDEQIRRVGFADTVEYIPRPLSTISSETSSSMSTARATHSVTGSITSIVSSGKSSPPPANNGRSMFETSPEFLATRPRPRTAGPIMNRFQQGLQPDKDVTILKRPSSVSALKDQHMNSAVPIPLPDWKFPTTDSGHADELLSETTSPAAYAPRGLHTLPFEDSFAKRPRRRSMSPPNSSTSRPRTSPEPNVTKRQRKVKSWGSMLSHKARPQAPSEKAIDSHPSIYSSGDLVLEPEFSLEGINFDEDTTCVIKTPILAPPTPAREQTDFSMWKPRESCPSPDSDSIQMLDLDAALGSSSTPSLGSELDDPVLGAFSVTRRRMHSSGSTGGFTGPGMHYHRRTESAPEMAINRPSFTGSKPAMADVFEEEEEDDDEGCESNQSQKIKGSDQDQAQEDEAALGLGVNIVDVDDTHDTLMQRSMRRGASTVCESNHRPTIRPQYSANSMSSVEIPEEISPVEIVGAEEEPRFSMVTKSSDESTLTLTLSHDHLINRPISAPIDSALRKANLSLPTPELYSSAVSSPDFSKTSFEVPRLHTAHSSITDRATLSSSRAGDHGFGTQASVEDVPSLTSSASTMMSGQPRRFSGSAYARSFAERSSSLSAAVPPRSRPATAYKRSSLASLSRLVGSSYGEKSKLSIEDRVQSDNAEKKAKKKGNRISRLMRFWKSKEKMGPS